MWIGKKRGKSSQWTAIFVLKVTAFYSVQWQKNFRSDKGKWVSEWVERKWNSIYVFIYINIIIACYEWNNVVLGTMPTMENAKNSFSHINSLFRFHVKMHTHRILWCYHTYVQNLGLNYSHGVNIAHSNDIELIHTLTEFQQC